VRPTRLLPAQWANLLSLVGCLEAPKVPSCQRIANGGSEPLRHDEIGDRSRGLFIVSWHGV